MPIARNIRYYREKHGLTQVQLADVIGVSRATISSWESKKTAVPVPTAKKVADYFGIDFTEFCDVDLEALDNLAEEDIHLTFTEKQNLIMFRKLPEEIKELMRNSIVTAYKRTYGDLK